MGKGAILPSTFLKTDKLNLKLSVFPKCGRCLRKTKYPHSQWHRSKVLQPIYHHAFFCLFLNMHHAPYCVPSIGDRIPRVFICVNLYEMRVMTFDFIIFKLIDVIYATKRHSLVTYPSELPLETNQSQIVSCK